VQTYWLITRQSQGQRVALKRLYQIYLDERNTRELYRVAECVLEIDPADLIALNNVAALGLLLDEDTNRSGNQIAGCDSQVTLLKMKNF
jgi:hypothetical protein